MGVLAPVSDMKALQPADIQQENPVVVRLCVEGLCWAGLEEQALLGWERGKGCREGMGRGTHPAHCPLQAVGSVVRYLQPPRPLHLPCQTPLPSQSFPLAG